MPRKRLDSFSFPRAFPSSLRFLAASGLRRATCLEASNACNFRPFVSQGSNQRPFPSLVLELFFPPPLHGDERTRADSNTTRTKRVPLCAFFFSFSRERNHFQSPARILDNDALLRCEGNNLLQCKNVTMLAENWPRVSSLSRV